MDKARIIEFFNRLAPQWDAEMVRNEPVISRILDLADIRGGVTVLDVGCGTGVLLPDYLARGVASVTGVDISPEMIRCAQEKFDSDPRVTLRIADVMDTDFAAPFDRCVVYNAFPHFSDPARLLDRLADNLVSGGRLTGAHGMSRERIDAHHMGAARDVSCGLPSADALAALFDKRFAVDQVVSDEEMYLVSGVKK